MSRVTRSKTRTQEQILDITLHAPDKVSYGWVRELISDDLALPFDEKVRIPPHAHRTPVLIPQNIELEQTLRQSKLKWKQITTTTGGIVIAGPDAPLVGYLTLPSLDKILSYFRNHGGMLPGTSAFMDFGHGDARVLSYASAFFNPAKLIGLEIDPTAFNAGVDWSRLWIKHGLLSQATIDLHLGTPEQENRIPSDIWGATHIYAFDKSFLEHDWRQLIDHINAGTTSVQMICSTMQYSIMVEDWGLRATFEFSLKVSQTNQQHIMYFYAPQKKKRNMINRITGGEKKTKKFLGLNFFDFWGLTHKVGS